MSDALQRRLDRALRALPQEALEVVRRIEFEPARNGRVPFHFEMTAAEMETVGDVVFRFFQDVMAWSAEARSQRSP